MSIFGNILHKIWDAAGAVLEPQKAAAADAGKATTPAPSAAAPASPTPAPVQSSPMAATPAPATPPVDVEAVLTQMATQKGGGGNWQTSIVDLLKLLDLDSSLDARKTLAGELNVHVGADGTAEENVALHKAVMQKLADNGGKVPDNLKG